ncbi:MAG: ATP synthase F1 subunit delta [Flavobacteriales bacterium]|jgi:F-type H+-transporting ATPase subunit delta|nr:ATP synthase F1 subunit delta [Flavobacteriales bacterium]
MRNPKVAHRYAKSLLDLATERNEVDAVEKDMRLISSTIQESRDLELLLLSPVVKGDKKENILKTLFGSHITEMTTGFIGIMTAKGREAVLAEVATHFLELTKKRKGILSAQVITATALTEEARAKINAIVSKLNSGGAVEIEESVDPAIVGGFVLKVEDKMIDASVLSQFRKLHREFDDDTYEAAL